MKVPRPLPAHAFVPAPEAQAFRFQSGGSARSLEELHARLAEAPAGVVWYHREHFPSWLRDVVGDDPLARRFAAYAAQAPHAESLRETLVGLVRFRLGELRGAAR